MKICKHLETILNHELSKGNVMREVTNEWTDVNAAVDLEKPMDIKYEKENIKTEPFVKYWVNKDTHYPLQEGFNCEQCKHSIGGPLKE